MNDLNDIQDYVRGNLTSVLPLVVILVIGLGIALFAVSSITPQLRARNQLLADMALIEATLASGGPSEQVSPDLLRAQIENMQERFDQAATGFLTEEQAATILNNLYRYADQSGVAIVDLQSQPPAQVDEENTVYRANVFRLQVNGPIQQLMDFISRIEEASAPGVVITNFSVTSEEDQNILVMDIVLYTSPYATGAGLEEAAGGLARSEGQLASLQIPPPPTLTPTATPAPTPVPVCDCSSNRYDCRDFSSQMEAQACYVYCGGSQNDVHLLDMDLNGIACETAFP